MMLDRRHHADGQYPLRDRSWNVLTGGSAAAGRYGSRGCPEIEGRSTCPDVYEYEDEDGEQEPGRPRAVEKIRTQEALQL